MTRLLLLNLLLGLGLGSVFLLPKAPPVQDSAVILNLPSSVGFDWIGGQDEETTDEVKEILKAQAYRNRSYEFIDGTLLNASKPRPIIQAGIVLSSDNVNQSIHRPERCLPAQGAQLIQSSSESVPVPEFGRSLRTTRLLTERKQKHPDGTVHRYRYITYYWFVGKDTVTNSHYERSVHDLTDRLLKGYSQRWAYITLDRLVGSPSTDPSDADQELQNFIAELAPSVIANEKITNW